MFMLFPYETHIAGGGGGGGGAVRVSYMKEKRIVKGSYVTVIVVGLK